MIFARLYAKAMAWAGHVHAPRYLAALSFAESSFFPIPPDVMLIPMSIERPERAWRFALLTTLSSVLGGIAGYLLGWLAFEAIEPALHYLGYWDKYLMVRDWFGRWGLWVVFVAGFSPIPYKLFTLSAGALSMMFLPFVLVSLIGRGARFFLVAFLVRFLKPRLGPHLGPIVHQYIEWFGWTTVVALLVAIVWIWVGGH